MQHTPTGIGGSETPVAEFRPLGALILRPVTVYIVTG